MHISSFLARETPDPRTTVPHVLPIYPTSSFVFESIEEGIDLFQNIEKGHVYSRYANPTVDAVARKLAELEAFGLPDLRPEAVMTNSGMSAISTLLLGTLKAGDKLLTQGNLYGGTTELLRSILAPLGVEPIFADLRDPYNLARILHDEPGIRMVYCETPANPTLACVDLHAISELAHRHGAWCAVDNTFCTPFLQQPFAQGVDFIVHSTTKFLNGHGNGIAGIIIGRDRDLMRQKVWNAMKLLGSNCSPFEAWLVHNGLKTLAVRMERHCTNALELARFLSGHPAVENVNYPGLPTHPDHELAVRQMPNGFGGMLSFELKGGYNAGIRLLNQTKLCTLAPTLGDVDTLLLHPASSSHLKVPRELREANGITDGLVRVSVGIEHVEDLKADLAQAMGG
ncbi:MAG: aminotransferase class I/II-fold pyridoxal phosphate-dependent enzyme [Saprospiraceae bacterium]|nr:aminotransferase class I/II-fold pyridoxal phosphate-dependent enzyme [Saprospiraceae bacterium]